MSRHARVLTYCLHLYPLPILPDLHCDVLCTRGSSPTATSLLPPPLVPHHYYLPYYYLPHYYLP